MVSGLMDHRSGRVSAAPQKNHEGPLRTLLCRRDTLGEQVGNNTAPDLISLQVVFRTDRKCARSPICLGSGLRPFSIRTIGTSSQRHHRSQPNLHRAKSTGNTVKVFAHAERTICAGQSMRLIDVPPSRPCMSARATPRSKDFGIGRVDHRTQD